MRNEQLHLVNYIGGLLKDSDYVYFVSYLGLKVKDLSELRGSLAKNQAECHVLKNTLIKKAAETFGLDALQSLELTGGTALIAGKGDPSLVAKTILDFGKTRQQLEAKGGYFEGVLLTSADVGAVAALPPKEVLQAQLLGVLQAPARDLVSVLNAKAATILNVLNAYKEEREKQA